MSDAINSIISFFTFKPLLYFWLLFFGYFISWLLAYVFSRLLIGTRQKGGRETRIEEACLKSWSVGLSLHALISTWTVFYVSYDYFTRNLVITPGESYYLGFYFLLVVIDVVLLLFLRKRIHESAAEWKQLEVLGGRI